MDPREIRSHHLPDMISPAGVVEIFEVCDAFWMHDGNPESPHAELTSGKCSDGFIDVLRVLRYTNLCKIFGSYLALKVCEQYDGPIDWVIGSDHAGATLSFAVASFFNVQHDFTEKGPDKTQLWKRFAIQPDEVVLQVEELITTTGTLQAVREGIRQGNPSPVTFAPVVATLIHRSDTDQFEDAPIVYLAHFDIQVWDPSRCPLCITGSKRVRPKTNWAELTGKS